MAEIADRPPQTSPTSQAEPTAQTGRLRRLARLASPRRVSALYFLALLFLIFSLWVPDTFLSWDTWRSLLNDQAIVALVAIGFVIPMAAGAFDLAVGAEVGFTGVLVAWFLAQMGVPLVPAMLLTVVAGSLVGLVNGFVVVGLGVDSFIATLGMSSVLLALTAWVSGGTQILDLSPAFQNVASNEILGITQAVWILLVVAIAVWYVLERTPLGRRVYATGGNREAARLAGIRTGTVILLCLVTCGAITGAAGVLNSSRIGVGDPTVGPDYLLPALAGVFLGSTQFRSGRVNVWGTVLAIYVLAVGTTGLQLAGAPVWIPDLFNGVALVVAVAAAGYQRRTTRLEAPCDASCEERATKP